MGNVLRCCLGNRLYTWIYSYVGTYWCLIITFSVVSIHQFLSGKLMATFSLTDFPQGNQAPQLQYLFYDIICNQHLKMLLIPHQLSQKTFSKAICIKQCTCVDFKIITRGSNILSNIYWHWYWYLEVIDNYVCLYTYKLLEYEVQEMCTIILFFHFQT